MKVDKMKSTFRKKSIILWQFHIKGQPTNMKALVWITYYNIYFFFFFSLLVNEIKTIRNRQEMMANISNKHYIEVARVFFNGVELYFSSFN